MSSARTFEFLGWAIVVAYIICLDALAPVLASQGLVPLWWLVLAGFVSGLYLTWWHPTLVREVGPLQGVGRAQVKFGFVLLGVTMFLSDPTVVPYLSRHGVQWLWLFTLALTLCWTIACTVRAIRSRHRTHPQ